MRGSTPAMFSTQVQYSCALQITRASGASDNVQLPPRLLQREGVDPPTRTELERNSALPAYSDALVLQLLNWAGSKFTGVEKPFPEDVSRRLATALRLLVGAACDISDAEEAETGARPDKPPMLLFDNVDNLVVKDSHLVALGGVSTLRQ